MPSYVFRYAITIVLFPLLFLLVVGAKVYPYAFTLKTRVPLLDDRGKQVRDIYGTPKEEVTGTRDFWQFVPWNERLIWRGIIGLLSPLIWAVVSLACVVAIIVGTPLWILWSLFQMTFNGIWTGIEGLHKEVWHQDEESSS